MYWNSQIQSAGSRRMLNHWQSGSGGLPKYKDVIMLYDGGHGNNLTVTASARVYFGGRYYTYDLQPCNVFIKVGEADAGANVWKKEPEVLVVDKNGPIKSDHGIYVAEGYVNPNKEVKARNRVHVSGGGGAAGASFSIATGGKDKIEDLAQTAGFGYFYINYSQIYYGKYGDKRSIDYKKYYPMKITYSDGVYPAFYQVLYNQDADGKWQELSYAITKQY